MSSEWTRYSIFRLEQTYITLALAGITALLALGILENIQERGLVGNLLEMEHNSAEYLHTLVEALRFSFTCPLRKILADSDSKPEGLPSQVILLCYTGRRLSNFYSHGPDSQHYVTDPDLQYVPVKELLDKVW